MSYQLYRNTTLGNTLQESLDELIQVDKVKHMVPFGGAINVNFVFVLSQFSVWTNYTRFGF